MNSESRTIQWLVWGLLFVVVLAVCSAYVVSKLKETRAGPLPVLGQLRDFTLTNQFGAAVSLQTFHGQVWVADIIFTRCAGPCPIMTRHLSELQAALPANSAVKLVSLTTDPDFDSPKVLKSYGEQFGARPERWMFLTGAKDQIARLAIHGLKLTAVEKQPQERETEVDLFIHSTIFVVVDKQGRLRGAFETTGPDVDARKAKQQILAAVNKLLQEEYVTRIIP